MKVCPECKQSFDSSIEECPDDGAALIDSPEALPPNPEPREVQLVRPDEATAMIDLDAMENQLRAYAEEKEEKQKENEQKERAQTTRLDPDATGEIDLAELERQRQERRDEEQALQEANAAAGTARTDSREPTQIARPPSLTDLSAATDIQPPPAAPEKKAQKGSVKLGLAAIAGILLIVLVVILIQQATSGAPITITTTPPGAAVFLDGEEIGKSPINLNVEPGNHTVSFELDGYEDFQEVITVPEEGLSFLEPLKAIPGWTPPAKKVSKSAGDVASEDAPKAAPPQNTEGVKGAAGMSADGLASEAQSHIENGNRQEALRAVKKMVLYFPNDARIDALFQLAGETNTPDTQKSAQKTNRKTKKRQKQTKEKVSSNARQPATNGATAGGPSNNKQAAKLSYQDGERLVRQMQYKRAKEAFKEAIRLDPRFFMPHRSLARIYERENNTRQAKYHLQRYLRLGGPDQDRRVKSWIESH